MDWRILGVVVALCAAFVIYSQYDSLTVAKEANVALMQKVADYAATNERLTERYLRTDTLLVAAKKEKADEQETSHTVQSTLRQSVSSDDCANRPVPAATLRLQSESLGRTRTAAGSH